MCIINEPAKVAKTKILVAPSSYKEINRQLTVYMNSVTTLIEDNAMILPVPFPKSVKFHNLDNYKDIFSDCESKFPKLASQSFSVSAEEDEYEEEETLEVFQTNGYDVSIVPDLASFNRLDKNVFELSSNVAELLKGKYSNKFGYLVCKLSTGNLDYQPLAYSHQLLENGKMFVPTLHYHGHEEADGKADWDHVIYSINNGARDQDLIANLNGSGLKFNLLEPEFMAQTQLTISKLELIGRYPNCDLSFSILK